MTDNDKEVSIFDAFEEAVAEHTSPEGGEEQQAGGDEAVDNKPESGTPEPASVPAEPSEEAPTDELAPDMSGTENWPEEMRAEYEKRTKGFQGAFTRKMQEVAAKEKSLEEKIRAEYDARFREVVSNLGVKTKDAEPEEKADPDSFAALANENEKAHAEALDKVVQGMINKALEPLKSENAALKQRIVQEDQAQAIRSEWVQLQKEHNLDDSFQNDMLAYAQANPEQVKGRSLKQIYRDMTWEQQREIGRKEVLAELERKKKEAVEVAPSASQTVPDEEVMSFAEAWEASVAEAAEKQKLKGS